MFAILLVHKEEIMFEIFLSFQAFILDPVSLSAFWFVYMKFLKGQKNIIFQLSDHERQALQITNKKVAKYFAYISQFLVL